MIICLTKDEIEKYATEIRKEFERLRQMLRRSHLEIKSHTREWEFFQHCFNVLMGDNSGDFDCDSRRARTYKYRVSTKLKEFYSSRADKMGSPMLWEENLGPIRFIFKLEARPQIKSLFDRDTNYRSTNGYLLLVTPADPTLNCVNQVRGALASVIDDAIHAEFDAYRKLPEAEVELRRSLKPYFDLDGDAYKKIVGEVKKHRDNWEVISNPHNPSTRPHLLEVAVEELTDLTAKVSTKECWNLHWLSTAKNVYVRLWEGQNSQRYVLVRRDGRWLVQKNKYDEPRG
jgi:hypothetical protein